MNSNFIELDINAIIIVKILLESFSSCLFIYLYTYPPVYMPAYLPARVPACYYSACLFASLSTYLPASLVLLFHPNALKLSIPLASIIWEHTIKYRFHNFSFEEDMTALKLASVEYIIEIPHITWVVGKWTRARNESSKIQNGKSSIFWPPSTLSIASISIWRNFW